MEIFISWSGKRSYATALAVREWLQRVLQFSDPFVSGKDIPKGAQWLVEISERLNSTTEGLVCVTPENQSNPWLNYEAGALANTTGQTAVRTILLDMEQSDISPGPLSSFQYTRALDKEDMKALVESINDRAVSGISDDTLTWVFESSWPELEATLRGIAEAHSEAPAPGPRDETEIAHETLELVRQIATRLANSPAPISARRDSNKLEQTRRGLTDLQVDDKIRHPSFGEGAVLAVEGQGDKRVVKVDFSGNEKRLLVRYAPIELIIQEEPPF